MCEPMSIITATLGAASMAMNMMGQIQQQKAQQKSAQAAAEYNSQVAANEAATQRQLAQNEIQKGAVDRERQQRHAARALGEMRANMGASGLEIDSGSNLSLLEESATEHQHDSNIIVKNAEQAAWQHMVAATGADNNAAFARYQGANAGGGKAGMLMGLGGTLLGGIGSAVGGYNSLQKTTAPGANGGGNYWSSNTGVFNTVSRPAMPDWNSNKKFF